MLKKENRITKDQQFAWVFKNSRPIYFGNLAIRFAKPKYFSPVPRFGFVISNKIEKRATRRNKLKRYLRNSVRESLTVLKPGIDIVVMVKSNFGYPYNYDEIREQFLGLMKRAGLIHRNDKIIMSNDPTSPRYPSGLRGAGK